MNLNQPEPSPLTQLDTAWGQAPSYLARFLVGLVCSVLSDVLMTSLLIGSVFLAFQTTFLIAAAAFFIIYAILGVGSGIALSIGQAGARRVMQAPPLPVVLPQTEGAQSSNK